QAEDGIRDDLVTGVQTCALPICKRRGGGDAYRGEPRRNIVRDVINPCGGAPKVEVSLVAIADHRVERVDSFICHSRHRAADEQRSEERRVGKERRAAGEAEQWT